MDVMCSAPQWLHHFHEQDSDGVQRIELNKKHSPCLFIIALLQPNIFRRGLFFIAAVTFLIFIAACKHKQAQNVNTSHNL